MADYTDIDKLREVAEKLYMWFSGAHAYWPDASPNMQAGWLHRAEQLLEPFTAELVRLRTEVDQLRGENAELRENVVHMESERTGKCLACGEDWACSGYYADIAHEARIENLITAYVAALQARIDAVVAVVQEQKQRNQGPAAKILDSVWMVRSDLLLAALGVDPQKETQQ